MPASSCSSMALIFSRSRLRTVRMVSPDRPACRIVPSGSLVYACWSWLSSPSFWRKLESSPPFSFAAISGTRLGEDHDDHDLGAALTGERRLDPAEIPAH